MRSNRHRSKQRLRQTGGAFIGLGAVVLGYAIATGLFDWLPLSSVEGHLVLWGSLMIISGLVVRHNERDYRGVFRPAGAVVMGLGVCIWACSLIAWGFEFFDPDPSKPDPWSGYLALGAAGGSALILGYGMAWIGHGAAKKTAFTRREAILAVCLIWMSASVVGGLPFLYGAHMPPHDALFEAVSGLTTTGATVITDIEQRLSRPLLLWRSLIQWLGGMGIVVLFVAVFPNVGVGGKHMFRGEVPGTVAEGLRPRIAETSIALWKLYALLTLIEMIILGLVGMDWFDALCHAFTTMSTGGFSTLDSSVGGFNNKAIEYIIAVFMLIGSVNYGLYYFALRGRSLKVFVNSVEFKVFVVGVGFAVIAFTAMFRGDGVHDTLELAFRKSLFLVGTSVSSTGYGSDNYTLYGPPALGLMIFIMFVGGCSGSTAGGIKIERIILLAKQSVSQVKKSFHPSAIQHVRMGKRVVDRQILADVAAFFLIYMACMAVGIFFVNWIEDCPVPTGFGAILTSLSNMGPAPFHDMAWTASAAGDVAPTVHSDNFAHYQPVTKVFCCLMMLVGRLEFFTIFALLVPGFWKR